ncbi:MAG: sigma-70 family RNA polymerase sigma factor [Lachnospiraceae bacterium]|nr:sigma-70 family RNA polymerase sigma factor [Lachnospiraceae bacterium]
MQVREVEFWKMHRLSACIGNVTNMQSSNPPQKPNALKPFFAKIIRNLALNRYQMQNAKKRGKDMVTIAIEELNECVSSTEDVESACFAKQLQKDVNRFLHTLPERDCDIFLRRYFFLENTTEIAKRYGIRDSNVLVILSRLRKKLKKFLRKEGYFI